MTTDSSENSKVNTKPATQLSDANSFDTGLTRPAAKQKYGISNHSFDDDDNLGDKNDDVTVSKGDMATLFPSATAWGRRVAKEEDKAHTDPSCNRK